MKIAVIGPLFVDSFAKNIAVTLETMGHQVWNHPGTRLRHNKSARYNGFWSLAPRIVPALEVRFRARQLAQLREFAPSLILATHDFFAAPHLETIKSELKCLTAIWFVDPITNMGRGDLFATHYDQYFFKEPMLVELFREKLGRPASYLPEACNPTWHRPSDVTPEQLRSYGCDVATQGTLHPYRASFYDAFAATDLSVKIWGSNISTGVTSASRRFFTGKYIGEQEKAIAFRAAKIVVDAMNYGEVFGVNQTLFDAAGSGAFVICDEKRTLSSLFAVDEEVVTFRTRPELLEKVRFYLQPQNEPQRLAMRERAWRRAHRDHTMRQRLEQLLATVCGS